MSKADNKVYFKNYHKVLEDPLVIYAYFEAINPSCTKLFGTHTFYEGGGGGGGGLSRPLMIFGNGRLYNLQLLAGH